VLTALVLGPNKSQQHGTLRRGEGSESTEPKHIDIAAQFVIGGMLRDKS
jgi:hypothetical protein